MAAAQHRLIRCPPPWASSLVVAKLSNDRLMPTTRIKQRVHFKNERLTRTFFLRFGVKNLLTVRASKMLWEGEIPI